MELSEKTPELKAMNDIKEVYKYCVLRDVTPAILLK